MNNGLVPGGGRSNPFREELSPVSFLERAGDVYSERVAVVDGGAKYTWGELRARSRRFSSALRLSGLRKGDRVAFVALNSEALLLAHFAILQAGGVLVAVNTRLAPGEVAFIVNHSDCRFVFYSPELNPLLTGLHPSIRTVQIGKELEAFLATGSDLPVESWLESEDELCAIDYTSGTTGRPKGVMYRHRGAFLNALAMVVENRLSPESCHLWTLPMFHCNGWSHTWAVAAAGSKSVCVPRLDPQIVWRLIDEESVTHFNAAPTVLITLAQHPAAHRLERSIRVCTGGAPPSPTLIAQMAAFNIELIHLYGLTETYGPLTVNVTPPTADSWAAERRAEYQARQGFPHVLAGSVQVVDTHLNEVPRNGHSIGEVVARGNTVMNGYYLQPEDTEEVFSGGWLHTGDLGVMHPDGSIELRDRKKDIIISGGENISTIEVEQAVASHPAVMEVAVIGIPDDTWGETPKAFVALKPGFSSTEAEIIAHVRERLAHFKAPREVEFGELPKTSTGKIQKFVLKDREWAGREKRIQ